MYHTQAVATNRMEIMSEDDIEEWLGTTTNVATFVGRGYGTVEVRFFTKEEVVLHTAKILRNRKVNLLPTYKGRRSIRL